jgi:hypothetical protein
MKPDESDFDFQYQVMAGKTRKPYVLDLNLKRLVPTGGHRGHCIHGRTITRKPNCRACQWAYEQLKGLR